MFTRETWKNLQGVTAAKNPGCKGDSGFLGQTMLLLDEPTNHLDMPPANPSKTPWRNNHGTLIHRQPDRNFLDKIADECFISTLHVTEYEASSVSSGRKCGKKMAQAGQQIAGPFGADFAR
jgi:hypothetical protein